MSESLHKHVECARTQTLKRLLKFPEVNVNCCLDGKTPIMVVCSINSDDEKCAEMYDVLIQAGALTYSKSDELWYIFLCSGCSFIKSAIAVMLDKLARHTFTAVNQKIIVYLFFIIR